MIRAWERRYGAVEPARTATNRRYYTDEQLERLTLLREATRAGRQIGQVAGLDTEELRALVAEDHAALTQRPGSLPVEAKVGVEGHLTASLAAVQRLDAQELRLQLERSSLELSQPQLLEQILVPLVQKIGKLWEEGTFRIAHEHVASGVIRSFLFDLQSNAVQNVTSPAIVVATPCRQYHEFGALLAAATASSEGWRVLYLGSDSPAEEIAALAVMQGAKAVALSIVYPADDPLLGSELRRIRRLIGSEIQLLVGGRASGSYSDQLQQISARMVSELNSLREELRAIRG